MLLQYDSTAEESDTTESHGVGASVQIAKNMHAVRASQALARLSGLCSNESSTPFNQTAAIALRALLTPKLASLLKDQAPKDLLSKLNNNLESPEVIFCFLLFYLSYGISSHMVTLYAWYDAVHLVVLQCYIFLKLILLSIWF